MQLIESHNEVSAEQRGRALQAQFQLASTLTQLRMDIEPVRIAACQLPCANRDDFSSFCDVGGACSVLDAQIALLEEQEARILASVGLGDASEQDIYAELQKYQRQTDLKVINQPIGVQIGYALQNQQKLVSRSQKNSLQLNLIGTGDLRPVTNAEGDAVYEKVGQAPQEAQGVFEDAQFYQTLLKLSTQQGGNIAELQKLQALQHQQNGVKKEHLILTKNRSLDTQTQFRRIVDFMQPKRFPGDEDQVLVVKRSLFGK